MKERTSLALTLEPEQIYSSVRNVEKVATVISLTLEKVSCIILWAAGSRQRATSNVINVGQKLVDRLEVQWETLSNGGVTWWVRRDWGLIC